MSDHSVIGICVTDGRLGLRLSEYVRRSGHRAQALTAHDIEAHRCGGLIWDLAPLDQAAPGRLRTFRNDWPVTPVLLYLRPAPDAGPIVQQCLGVPMVRLEFQASIGQEGPLVKAGIRWLLDADVEGRLTRVATALFGAAPANTPRFLSLAAQWIAAEQGVSEPTIAQLAGALGVTERTLEYWCEAGDLPAPKRTVMWLDLLYLALAADSLEADILETAARLGVDTKRLRERLRTLVPMLTRTSTTPAHQLDCVLTGLVQECRLPADRLAAARSAAA